MVRYDSNSSVLNAGCLNYVEYLLSDVVEGGDPASGLKLEFFLINLEFHVFFSFSFEYFKQIVCF